MEQKLLPDNVFEIRVRTQGNTLGALRNIGNRLAQGDYVIQWDDDDFSRNDRLEYQVTHTPEDHMSIFRYEVHSDLTRQHSFVNCGRQVRCKGFPGTMLYPAQSVCAFPDKGKAEDTEFVLAMQEYFDLKVLKNYPLLYVRFYHGHNTWGRYHVMKQKPGSRELTEEEARYVYRVRQRYLDAMER